MSIFERKFRVLMLFVDWVLIVLSFVLAYWVRFGTLARTDFLFYDFMVVALVVSVIWLLMLVAMRVYALGRSFLSWFHLERLILGNVAGVATFVMVFFFWRHTFYSRLVIVYLWCFASLVLIFAHVLATWVKGVMVRNGFGVVPALVVGSNRMAQGVIKHLQETHATVQPVVVLDGYGASVKSLHGVPVEGKLDKLEAVVDREGIRFIIQADNIEHALNLIAFAEKRGIEYRLLPSLLGMYHQAETVYMEGMPVIKAAGKRKLSEIIFGR